MPLDRRTIAYKSFAKHINSLTLLFLQAHCYRATTHIGSVDFEYLLKFIYVIERRRHFSKPLFFAQLNHIVIF